MKIGREFQRYDRGQTNTHTQTDRNAHHNTPLPYRRRSNKRTTRLRSYFKKLFRRYTAGIRNGQEQTCSGSVKSHCKTGRQAAFLRRLITPTGTEWSGKTTKTYMQADAETGHLSPSTRFTRFVINSANNSKLIQLSHHRLNPLLPSCRLPYSRYSLRSRGHQFSLPQLNTALYRNTIINRRLFQYIQFYNLSSVFCVFNFVSMLYQRCGCHLYSLKAT